MAEWFHGIDAEFESGGGHFGIEFLDIGICGGGVIEILLPASDACFDDVADQLGLFADELFGGDEEAGVGVKADI